MPFRIVVYYVNADMDYADDIDVEIIFKGKKKYRTRQACLQAANKKLIEDLKKEVDGDYYQLAELLDSIEFFAASKSDVFQIEPSYSADSGQTTYSLEKIK